MQTIGNSSDRVTNISGGIVTSITTGDKEYVTELRPADVLFGRGSGPNDHEGNIRFRTYVYERKAAYMATNHRLTKTKIARDIVTLVFNDNGRFLKKLEPHEIKAAGFVVPPDSEEEVCIYEVQDDDTLMEKAKQALRQNANKFREEQMSSSARQGASNHETTTSYTCSQTRPEENVLSSIPFGANQEKVDVGDDPFSSDFRSTYSDFHQTIIDVPRNNETSPNVDSSNSSRGVYPQKGDNLRLVAQISDATIDYNSINKRCDLLSTADLTRQTPTPYDVCSNQGITNSQYQPIHIGLNQTFPKGGESAENYDMGYANNASVPYYGWRISQASGLEQNYAHDPQRPNQSQLPLQHTEPIASDDMISYVRSSLSTRQQSAAGNGEPNSNPRGSLTITDLMRERSKLRESSSAAHNTVSAEDVEELLDSFNSMMSTSTAMTPRERDTHRKMMGSSETMATIDTMGTIEHLSVAGMSFGTDESHMGSSIFSTFGASNISVVKEDIEDDDELINRVRQEVEGRFRD